jgi:hypothetical protein
VIDTRTHNLKRGEDGSYRVGQKSPCGHCGHIRTCQIKPRQTCSDFMPALTFLDETGLLGNDPVNTVRVGQAWPVRLFKDQIVALYNPKRKEVFGYSKVISTSFGPIATMLFEHAHRNHIMLDRPEDDAPRALGEWLRRNYGPRIINPQTTLTAVYVQRVNGPNAPPSVEGNEAHRIAEGSSTSSGQDYGDREGLSPTRS